MLSLNLPCPPTGAIILFSGLGGDRAEAQEQISVGVGALAGSTTLLLTLPWAMSVYLGRVDHSATTGRPQYRRPANWRTAEHGKWHKLQQTHALRGLTTTGVTCGAAVRSSTLALGCSSLLYVMIQAPAMTRSFRTIDAPVSDEDAMAVAAFERPFAIAALVVSLAAFVGYLASKVASADHDPVLTFRAEVRAGLARLRPCMPLRRTRKKTRLPVGDVDQLLRPACAPKPTNHAEPARARRRRCASP